MKQMRFLDMFSDYNPVPEDREKLDRLYIRRAEIDYPQGAISVILESEEYISRVFLTEIAREAEFVYGLKKLELEPRYPAHQLKNMESAELLMLFVEENSMCMGALAGATWEWEGTSLSIQLRANGKRQVEECVPGVVRRLKALCDGGDVSIAVHSGKDLEGQALFDELPHWVPSICCQSGLNHPPSVQREAAGGHVARFPFHR